MTTEPRRFARTLRDCATSAEDVLWRSIRGRRLHGLKFKRQVPLMIYTVDFLCFERKLVVELDGRQHAWNHEYDAGRTRAIERSGFTVLRFLNEDVLNDLDAILNRISTACGEGPQPFPSLIDTPPSGAGGHP
ncbi:DUF559 domain-containing protein [uncultured Methylobacterium sp.]|jgi:very-short-patch-repair endonuclease|uniref:endonuclease domain-containing protein n=1 Tax=uncultured Methylobacterium sp. TaxID=157278 RepID=UPI002623B5D2|nr:DUF559 domain-containing protein [uncultured Methylobacterium sp.]